jgi:hypothetical protein
MTDSLRALLANVFDYAGLFPPARLPLDEAVRNYARYRQEADSWMLGEFVMPVGRLGELEPYVPELFAAGPPLSVTVLGSGGDTAESWTQNVRADAEAITRFQSRHGERVLIEVFETRLPDSVWGSALGLPFADCLTTATTALDSGIALFLETSLNAAHLATLRQRGLGFKFRCGGPAAAAFPTAAQVAHAILACAAARVPLKLTAGLHHPLPRHDAGVGATMHGFVNVLLADALARAGRAAEAELVELLADADPTHFQWDDSGVAWKDLRVSTAEVARARGTSVLSVGSCSFDEPRGDLRALGWM